MYLPKVSRMRWLSRKLNNHPVECAGQLPYFVGRRHVDRLIEAARLNRPCTLEQLPDRANDTAANKIGEYQSHDRGKQGSNDGDNHRLNLLRPDRCNGAGADRQHVGPNGVDLLVEFVAQRVDPYETTPYRCEVPRLEILEQLRRLLLQVTSGIAHQAIDATFDASQCYIVRRCARIFDDRIDELTCGLRLAIDLRILGIVELLASLIPLLIGRLLHFRDHHSAERKSPFERQNIDPRQVRVGGYVPYRQFVKQMPHLSNHHHRQD